MLDCPARLPKDDNKCVSRPPETSPPSSFRWLCPLCTRRCHTAPRMPPSGSHPPVLRLPVAPSVCVCVFCVRVLPQGCAWRRARDIPGWSQVHPVGGAIPAGGRYPEQHSRGHPARQRKGGQGEPGLLGAAAAAHRQPPAGECLLVVCWSRTAKRLAPCLVVKSYRDARCKSNSHV